MSINDNLNAVKPDYELLREYIKEALAEERALEVRDLLENNSTWFEAYVELKEALFLQKTGKEAEKHLQKKIMGRIKQKKKNYFRVFLKILKEQTIVTSSDSESLGFQGVGAVYAYRGVQKHGAVSVEKELGDHKIKIKMMSVENTEQIQLETELLSEKNLLVDLQVDNSILESATLEQGIICTFENSITSDGTCTLIFTDSENENFTVDLIIQNET